MTKREFLESKGYKCESRYDEEIPELLYKMYEGYDGVQDMTMFINWAENKYFIELTTVGNIEDQKQINDLQIAFNRVKDDFAEMQKYDD